jgi:hypothetical protein
MADSIEIDVTNYNGKAQASFTLPRNRMNALTIYVEDGDVTVDGLEYEGEQSSLYIPLDTLRAAMAAHDTAALWSDSDKGGWERTDASGCQWQIRMKFLGGTRHSTSNYIYTVFRNDGDGFVQVGEPHATWGKAMFAVEGMVAR